MKWALIGESCVVSDAMLGVRFIKRGEHSELFHPHIARDILYIAEWLDLPQYSDCDKDICRRSLGIKHEQSGIGFLISNLQL